jgi:hypothetical protein
MGKNKQVVDWQAMAEVLAAEAHEDHFSSRRGLWTLGNEGGKLIACYYNNNPYSEDAEPLDSPSTRRGREVAAFRAWLREQADVSELASASYPEDGYTITLILKATPESLPEIERQLLLSIQRQGLHVVSTVEARG